jgi:hypothetical protein
MSESAGVETRVAWPVTCVCGSGLAPVACSPGDEPEYAPGHILIATGRESSWMCLSPSCWLPGRRIYGELFGDLGDIMSEQLIDGYVRHHAERFPHMGPAE